MCIPFWYFGLWHWNCENTIWNEFKSNLEALETKQGNRKNKRIEKKESINQNWAQSITPWPNSLYCVAQLALWRGHLGPTRQLHAPVFPYPADRSGPHARRSACGTRPPAHVTATRGPMDLASPKCAQPPFGGARLSVAVPTATVRVCLVRG